MKKTRKSGTGCPTPSDREKNYYLKLVLTDFIFKTLYHDEF